MNQRLKTLIKSILPIIILDSSKLRYLSYAPLFCKWVKENEGQDLFDSKYDLYKYLNSVIIKNIPIDYFEFGVYKGESFRKWLALNTNVNSRFYGFDTFGGLPEDWINFIGTLHRGAFDAKGVIPLVNDNRAMFIKGLFQDTLTDFLKNYKSSRQIVIHNDSDLYSSSLFLLTKCSEIISPGTILIFDEFSNFMHEFRAFEDFCSAYRIKYKVLCSTRSKISYFDQVAVMITQ